jgi:hypothetical protein
LQTSSTFLALNNLKNKIKRSVFVVVFFLMLQRRAGQTQDAADTQLNNKKKS